MQAASRHWSWFRGFALALAFTLGVGSAFAQKELRVVAWNLQTVGAPGTGQYQAALAVLGRIGADVVALAEVASAADVANCNQLAADLGYPYTMVAPAGPFGDLRGAFLSVFPLRSSLAWSAAALSGDTQANDITRYILELEVDVSGQGDALALITTHWKSGVANSDEFRRVIESIRVSAVAGDLLSSGTPFVVMGDMNEDIRDGARAPGFFTAAPSGLPTNFRVGADITETMTSDGLANDPFRPLATLAVMLDAKQLDGNYATRPASGRRIDYLFADRSLQVLAAQVFDCADEHLLGGVVLVGAPLAADVCAQASDHLPVLADLIVPTFSQVPRLLTVILAGTGGGSVSSSPTGMNCGTDCSEAYPAGTSVTLTATPTAGSIFNGWNSCAGPEPSVCGGISVGTGTCTLSMSAATWVAATFSFVGAGSAKANEWVQKSYVAYYGRPADPGGLAYWAARMDAEGGSLSSIIEAFGKSDEFTRRYGGLTYSQLIDTLYEQTLGRAPDPSGRDWYLSQLNLGRTTPQTITLDLLGGATGLDAQTVANRLDVANHFTGKVGAGCPYGGELTGVSSLNSVSHDSATTWAAKLGTEVRCRP